MAPGGVGAGASGSGGKLVGAGRAGGGGSIRDEVCMSAGGGKLLDVDPDAGGASVPWPSRGAMSCGADGGGPDGITPPAG